MGDEELLNSPPRELQKSNLNNIRINPEQQNQEALNIPLINVEVQSTESKSISERNLSADNENFDGGKKEIVKARTEGKPSVDTKKKPKRLFSFEALVRAMYCGEVSALLAEHSLQGVPHRGISVERLCVPLIALIGNKMIKSGKVVDREMVELPTGRRILASVGKIKAYETRLHDRLVTTLTSKTWESIELNSFTEGQQPLFNNVSTKVLTINLRSSCINMRFVACKSAEFLWWNSMPAGREMLKHFPALKGVAYSDCNFLKKVIISSRIRILICFNEKCKCNFRNVFGKRKRPYVITCPNTCQGGPAMLAYAELTDIWRLGQWTQIFN